MQKNATTAQYVITLPCHAVTAVAGIMMRDNLPPRLPGLFCALTRACLAAHRGLATAV